jgi:hypothetical protein
VKIIVHGPLAGPGWDGSPALKSWGPDEVVEVSDKDEKAVAWARGWAATPHATLVEDVKEKEPPKEKETKAPAQAAAKAETKADVPASAHQQQAGRRA